MKLSLRIALISLIAASGFGGINWKSIWLEPNPVVLQQGDTIPYAVKGIHGGGATREITKAPHLKIVSADPEIVEVDRQNVRLIGKSVGQTEIRISFGSTTGVARISVTRRAAEATHD